MGLEEQARALELDESGFEEGNARLVPGSARFVEVWGAIVVADGGVGAGVQEQLHDIGEAICGSPIKSRPSVNVLRVQNQGLAAAVNQRRNVAWGSSVRQQS